MTDTSVVVRTGGAGVLTDTATPLLKEVQDRIKHPGPALLGPVADSMRATEQGVFLSAGASIGAPWEPLAESTLRKKHGNSAMLLVDEGRLWESLTVPDAEFSVAELTDNDTSMRFGTDDPNAVFHQGGTVDMPARPVVPDPWPQEDVEHWVAVLHDFFIDGEL